MTNIEQLPRYKVIDLSCLQHYAIGWSTIEEAEQLLNEKSPFGYKLVCLDHYYSAIFERIENKNKYEQ